MPRFSAHLGYLFHEWSMEDRFVAAREAGFKGVDLAFPYDIPLGRLGDLLAMNGLELASFNAPAGDWEKGERGLAALPGRRREFLVITSYSIHYTKLYEASSGWPTTSSSTPDGRCWWCPTRAASRPSAPR